LRAPRSQWAPPQDAWEALCQAVVLATRDVQRFPVPIRQARACVVAALEDLAAKAGTPGALEATPR
jgi:hypothetical protein